MTQTLLQPGLSLDAPIILGLGPLIPGNNPGEYVFHYDGWSLQDLRMNQNVLMSQETWYDTHPWATEKLPSGIYVLRLPVPDSNRKTFAEQKALLLPEEEPAPIVLAATALLAIRLSGGDDPLRNGWARCKEQNADDGRVVLRWRDGRLLVRSRRRDDRRGGIFWLAAARKID